MRTLFLAVLAGAAILASGPAKPEPLKITVTLPSRERDYERWWNLQLRCIADAVYTEARGEDEYAQHLVAHVIMRRIWEHRPEWPATPCGNVYKVTIQKGELVSQFSGPVHIPVAVSDTDREYLRSTLVAVEVMLGYWKPKPEHACAIAYQNKKQAAAKRQGWFETLAYIGTLGKHAFYCLPTSVHIAKK